MSETSFEEQTKQRGKWQCEGCDATFEGTAEEAFNKGWDIPPYFSVHIICENCPITSTNWWRLLQAQKEAQ